MNSTSPVVDGAIKSEPKIRILQFSLGQRFGVEASMGHSKDAEIKQSLRCAGWIVYQFEGKEDLYIVEHPQLKSESVNHCIDEVFAAYS